MDTSAKVTFCGPRNPTEGPLSEIHLLPCHIAHTGPAKVQAYFHREPLGDNGDEKATFRGRFLDGSVVHIPEGFRLFVTKERSSNGVRRVLDEEASVDRFKLWEYDRTPSDRNPIPRAVNFLKIATDLASDD